MGSANPSCTDSLQLLVALGKSVGVRVVEERVVAVAPGEWLISDAEVAVREELRLPVFRNMLLVFFLLGVGVVRHEKACWDGNKKRNPFPKGKGTHSVAFFLFDSLFEG